ncbi:helix-turn-helix domain-containing protein [Nitrogeniibacter aestuarii]|uniref:helix-turn-helix domain-containing protein n=1 Tax=Nitrogeniibacter aestuarii TaxID=2815343 RepID=UPI001D12AF4F|nr:helix-turn-helix transcriptional regulator [Nitrogeniibacter aestuarii]
MLNITRIREEMARLGLNQSELADACAVSKESVSNWLGGESCPRPKKLKRLAEIFGFASTEELFASPVEQMSPIVAFRTHRNRAVTGDAKEAADDVARHLRELMPYIRKDVLFAPAVLEGPVNDDMYVRSVVRQVRERLGVGAAGPVTREHLLSLHESFGTIFVPVYWGKEKSGHENALSVHLPDTKAYFVVVSLNAKNDDFNYWLAHELGHCYSLHALQGDAGEDFAERFAQELLFPVEAAVEACRQHPAVSELKRFALLYAGKYDISLVTVYKQLEKAAEELAMPSLGLLTTRFWTDWQKGRAKQPTVSKVMLGADDLTIEEYVLQSEKAFSTPIFRAIAERQAAEGHESPSFVSAALNIDMGSAIDLCDFLSKLNRR